MCKLAFRKCILCCGFIYKGIDKSEFNNIGNNISTYRKIKWAQKWNQLGTEIFLK